MVWTEPVPVHRTGGGGAGFKRVVSGYGVEAELSYGGLGTRDWKPGDIVPKHDAVIGVADHGGWAVLVTAARDGTLLDRRRVELVDEGLPTIPHHSEGQSLPADEAVRLVERVRVSAERYATLALDAVALAVPARIAGVALRECPELPASIAERITDYRARNVADWVMYRRAIAGAAEARGWAVHWYDAKTVIDAAGEVMGIKDIDAHLSRVRDTVGPPWGKDQRVAMAAAIAAYCTTLP
jgi:hypothetical protein